MFSPGDYHYELPPDRIAQHPADRRESSRLLTLNRQTGETAHHVFSDLPDFLRPGDVLVVNDTEVIPARLLGRKESGGRVEALILNYGEERCTRESDGSVVCECLLKLSKRPRPGIRLHFGDGLDGEVLDSRDGVHVVRFTSEGDFEETLYRIGQVPLPPYIRGGSEEAGDAERYQTVYAARKGAVAAPTAGLHFSPELLDQIRDRGVSVAAITLHVGHGTFIPVRVDDIREHEMHREWFSLSAETAETINRARESGGRVIAVGTTSVRTLEYVSDEAGRVAPTSGDCDLFIYPGYRFRIVDAMITNFHLPESTLLMLVSAFAGRDNVLAAYRTAVDEGYRFYSYGDAMFIG
jgi:S-adenosylmethionine:tRNA ribosyltransferase-isomerase